MVTINNCLASLARLSLSPTVRPSAASISCFLAPAVIQTRNATDTGSLAARKKEREKMKRKKRQARFKEYKYAVPSEAEQYSLCDAMRYLRAAEVGRPPSSVTYEVSLKIRTIKNSPVIRNRVRFPYPVKNDTRIAVICKENSPAMNDAKQYGAVAYGEESLFKLITAQSGNLPFNRLLCHTDSLPALQTASKKEGLGRILGPKGLMPSIKHGSVTKSVKAALQEMVGSEDYREKIGAIRMPVGNILFTPKQLGENLKTIIMSVKGDIYRMEDRVAKDLIEVVLTTTNGPGFSLHGGFLPTDENITPEDLSTTM